MKYRGVTLVFVTHQLDQVRNLCDRALWLDHGETAQIGDPVRVVDAYLQEVAAPQAVAPPAPEAPQEPKAPADEEERFGSGEVILRHVALVDNKGFELVALGAGSAVAIEIDVDVRVPQDDFVFGLGIYHADGTCVYGTNTDLEGLAPERLESSGRVRFVMPSLDLVAGQYRVDAAVHTRNGRSFDYRRGVLRFVVGSRVHDTGVYRPKHTWQFEGGISLRPADLRRNVPASIAEAIDASKKKS
jgi:ABC-type glutathione transport system ATPase component